MRFLRALMFAGLLCAAGGASALPVSSCALNGLPQGIDCNFYFSDAGGNPSSTSSLTSLPLAVVAGFVVVVMPLGDPNQPADWLAVLALFDDGGGTATTGQMLGPSCSCLPTLSEVLGAAHAFLFANPLGTQDTNPTVFLTGTNTYNLFVPGPIPAPEPATLLLLAIAVMAGAFARRARR